MNILLRLEESGKTFIPEHFYRLIESVHADRTHFKPDQTTLEAFNSENDYAVCILVTVALECGFRLNSSNTKNFDIRVCRETCFMAKWRDTTRRLYTIDLFLPDLEDQRFVLLVVPVLGNALLVNLISLRKNEALRASVEPMLPLQWLNPFQTSIPERFNNLPGLARSVLRFFQKEKDVILNAANQSNPSLLGIPDELKRNIFKHLSAVDFVFLTTTCRKMASYRKDRAVWKIFLMRDFKMDSEYDPYDLYVSKKCASRGTPSFTDQIFPLMLHQTTSISSLQNFQRV